MYGEASTVRKPSRKNWRPRDILKTSWDFRPRVEEVPERSPINNDVVDGATYENTIRELRYLYSKQRFGGALQISNSIEWEKRVDKIDRNIDRVNDIRW